MPRFFFDIDENGKLTPDDVGTELLARHLVPAEARRFLLDVSRELAITDADLRIKVSVRADDGMTPIHWTSMLLKAAWA